MKLLMLSVSSLLLLSCASYKVPNFKAYITLPASEDGFGITTVTKEETRIPKGEWEEKKKRGIIILSEDYAILKISIKQNCRMRQCEQLVGYFDQLFLSLDDALQKVNP